MDKALAIILRNKFARLLLEGVCELGVPASKFGEFTSVTAKEVGSSVCKRSQCCDLCWCCVRKEVVWAEEEGTDTSHSREAPHRGKPMYHHSSWTEYAKWAKSVVASVSNARSWELAMFVLCMDSDQSRLERSTNSLR